MAKEKTKKTAKQHFEAGYNLFVAFSPKDLKVLEIDEEKTLAEIRVEIREILDLPAVTRGAGLGIAKKEVLSEIKNAGLTSEQIKALAQEIKNRASKKK